ncbi:hypothetical protein D3C87_1876930 [compost metagenome]
MRMVMQGADAAIGETEFHHHQFRAIGHDLAGDVVSGVDRRKALYKCFGHRNSYLNMDGSQSDSAGM